MVWAKCSMTPASESIPLLATSTCCSGMSKAETMRSTSYSTSLSTNTNGGCCGINLHICSCDEMRAITLGYFQQRVNIRKSSAFGNRQQYFFTLFEGFRIKELFQLDITDRKSTRLNSSH